MGRKKGGEGRGPVQSVGTLGSKGRKEKEGRSLCERGRKPNLRAAAVLRDAKKRRRPRVRCKRGLRVRGERREGLRTEKEEGGELSGPSVFVILYKSK